MLLPEGWSRDRIMQDINALNVAIVSVATCSEVYLEHAFDGTAMASGTAFGQRTAIG